MRRAGQGHQQYYQFPTPHQASPAQQHSHQAKTRDKHRHNEKPPFVVENFDQPSCSGYSKRVSSSLLSHGKRKSDSESSFHPLTKQQITEERITKSMQHLSLGASNNRPVNYQAPSSSSRTADEGFFEDLHDISSEEEDLETEHRDSKFWTGRNAVLSLAPGVKETLKKFEDDILPKKIIQEMNRNSLALIPYQPSPLHEFTIGKSSEFELGVNNDKIELVFNKNTTTSNIFNVKAEMDIDDEEESREGMVE